MNLFCLLFYSSWQTNQIRLLIFWENLRRASLLFGFIWPLKTIPQDLETKKILRTISFIGTSYIWELELFTLHMSFQFPDMVPQIIGYKNLLNHGLPTTNEGINQRYRKNLATVADKIWDWNWIFGHAVKTISSLDVRSPCIKQILNFGLLWAVGLQRKKMQTATSMLLLRAVLLWFQGQKNFEFFQKYCSVTKK